MKKTKLRKITPKLPAPATQVSSAAEPADRCAVCGETNDHISDRCLTCGADIGAPNVRLARSAVERSALRVRYDDAVYRAQARGALDVLRLFERELASSGAVVNCSLSFLKDFVTQPKTLFANYHQTVQAGVRKAALPERDQERTVVDAIMFGSFASAVRFAALSLNNRGVESYGPYSLRLRDIAVANRSSLLEENSFDFVRRHSLGPRVAAPQGFRSDWNLRSELAVAKLGDLLGSDTRTSRFAQILLRSEGKFERRTNLWRSIFLVPLISVPLRLFADPSQKSRWMSLFGRL